MAIVADSPNRTAFAARMSDVILYLTVGPHSIVARVDAHSVAKMGQQIEVVFNMRKMHLFDPQTQGALV